MKEKFKILLLLLLLGSQVFGQSLKITGTVTDDNGETLPGATIVLVGKSQGTITDIEGKYTINVNTGDQLKFSFIGFKDQVKPVGKNLVINVQLSTGDKALEEVIVVGYGGQTRKTMVGAVAQTAGENLKSKGTLGSLTDALSGAMPGVMVMTNSSAPGGGGVHGSESTILIRGMNSWNSSAPLILVDGMERSMNDVSLDEIENFSVLKDASATAVYGVKGANGVILITTKRGQIGKAKVSAEVNFSRKTISRIETSLDSYQGLLARNYAIIHELPLYDNITSYYTSPRVLGYYRDGVEPEKYTNVDWPSVMLRDHAYSSNYNVNISGGTDFVKYFTTLSYLHEGDMLNSGKGIAGYSSGFSYDRVNFRTNLDFNITKTTVFKVNLSGYFGNQEQPADGEADINQTSIWQEVYKANPISPLPIYSDGIYGSDDPLTAPYGRNSLFYLLNGGRKLSKKTSLTSDFDLEQDLDFITKGLSAKGRFSFDNFFTSNGRNIDDNTDDYSRKYYDIASGKWIYPEISDGKDGFDFVVSPVGYSDEWINNGSAQRNFLYEIHLNYKRSFDKHNVSALALFSREEKAAGSNWPTKREDWVGRLTYNYDGKYLFETNGAYNGSEKFGPGYKFDFFPSFALGWRLSEENFIKDNIPQISNLKLRYTIGWVGSDNLGKNVRWAYLTNWKKHGGSGPAFGAGKGISAIYSAKSYEEGTTGNPSIRWETVRKQNFGVDIALFDDLITGTVDYFRDYRYDMFISSGDRAVPDYYGATPPSANLGKVKSSGYEIEFKIQKKFGNTNLWASCNWSQAIGEIIFKEDPELAPFYQKQAGYKIGQVKTAYVSDFIGSWDELYAGVMNQDAFLRSQTLPGDVRTIDFNADGIVNVRDNVPYGYSTKPENTYGLTLGADYKGFSASAQFYGFYNTTINSKAITSFQFNSAITFKYLMDRTTTPEYGVEDPSRSAYRLKPIGDDGRLAEVDGSMLRLKTLQLSYTLPSKIVKALSIDKLKIFVSGNNLFIVGLLPYDVEGATLDDKRYPTTKAISFGLNITL